MKKNLILLITVVFTAVSLVAFFSVYIFGNKEKPLFLADGSFDETAFAYNISLSKKNGTTLFDSGNTEYTIIYAQNASQMEMDAVDFLVLSLKEISGIQFLAKDDSAEVSSYEICIGQTNRTFEMSKALNDIAAYTITITDKNIYLYGNTVYGSSNAVYGFLEDYLGSMFFAPGEYYYPSLNKAILAPIEDFQEPAFEGRDLYSANALEHQDFRRMLRLSGTEVFDANGCHTSLSLISTEEYFEEHPEYFAYIKGARRGGMYMFQRTQLCWSNPNVIELLKEKMGEKISAYEAQGGTREIYWDMSQEDSMNRCECPTCTAMYEHNQSGIGPMLNAVNEVAKAFPSYKFSTLAYHAGSTPPINIVPEENVLIKYCIMSEYGKNDMSLPLRDAVSDIGKKQYEEMVGWSELTDNIYVWDYLTNYFNYQLPFPLFQSLQGNYQLMAEKNIRGIFSLSAYNERGSSDTLKDYLVSKLLWNPYCEYDNIMNKYITLYYGDASPFIRQYYREIKERLQGKLWVYDFPITHNKDYLSEISLDTYQSLFDDAFAAVEGQETFEKRLRYDYISILYAKISLNYDNENRATYKTQLLVLCDEFDIVLANEIGGKLVDT